jgi:hypothetical protein
MLSGTSDWYRRHLLSEHEYSLCGLTRVAPAARVGAHLGPATAGLGPLACPYPCPFTAQADAYLDMLRHQIACGFRSTARGVACFLADGDPGRVLHVLTARCGRRVFLPPGPAAIRVPPAPAPEEACAIRVPPAPAPSAAAHASSGAGSGASAPSAAAGASSGPAGSAASAPSAAAGASSGPAGSAASAPSAAAPAWSAPARSVTSAPGEADACECGPACFCEWTAAVQAHLAHCEVQSGHCPHCTDEEYADVAPVGEPEHVAAHGAVEERSRRVRSLVEAATRHPPLAPRSAVAAGAALDALVDAARAYIAAFHRVQSASVDALLSREQFKELADVVTVLRNANPAAAGDLVSDLIVSMLAERGFGGDASERARGVHEAYLRASARNPRARTLTAAWGLLAPVGLCPAAVSLRVEERYAADAPALQEAAGAARASGAVGPFPRFDERADVPAVAAAAGEAGGVAAMAPAAGGVASAGPHLPAGAPARASVDQSAGASALRSIPTAAPAAGGVASAGPHLPAGAPARASVDVSPGASALRSIPTAPAAARVARRRRLRRRVVGVLGLGGAGSAALRVSSSESEVESRDRGGDGWEAAAWAARNGGHPGSPRRPPERSDRRSPDRALEPMSPLGDVPDAAGPGAGGASRASRSGAGPRTPG